MSRRRSKSEAMNELEEGAGSLNRAEAPRPGHRRWLTPLLALISTLLLALYLTTQFRHLSPPDIQDLEAPSSDHVTHSDRSRLHPADHISRNPTTITHTWNITSGLRRPDGVLKRAFLINDEFPGPTLEARSGDTLVIRVENGLDDDGVAIHFHGLHMRGANDMDGAVGVTQDPIPPGQSFTYRFTIDEEQYGTFWYHAHEGVQRADGLFGGLVVHKPVLETVEGNPADEKLILVGDWYHRNATDALQFYMHPGAFGLETIPDSILINGRGSFRCIDAVPARPLDCLNKVVKIESAFHLDGSKRTILRVVNVGAYAGLDITVPGARLTPLTVDGGTPVAGQPSKSVGFIQPGERVDMLIEVDSEATQHDLSFQVTLDDSIFKYENSALSISHSWPIDWNRRLSDTASTTIDHTDVDAFESLHDQSGVVPAQADQTIVLYTLTQKLARLDNEPRGFINSSTWRPQSPPLIERGRDDWDEKQFVPHVPFRPSSPLWIDIVLNNLDEDSHPFHLHGHNFWVLARYSSDINWGSYNPYEDQNPPGGAYNIETAVRKDTVYVPRRGYVVLRFKADNPGIWAFHCHVLWHKASGMAMAFDIS